VFKLRLAGGVLGRSVNGATTVTGLGRFGTDRRCTTSVVGVITGVNRKFVLTKSARTGIFLNKTTASQVFSHSEL
jgi:hypothetical protein